MRLSMRKTYDKNGNVKNNGYTANIPKAIAFEAFGEEHAHDEIQIHVEGKKIVIELKK
ncbi:hypothetical protein phiLdb_00053 [Lactobacillus phage phiLdb]|uniref:Uncharacterized protein n=1 Tax=Lactobacillus phage phiLdb TaxID=1399942 RepID=U3PJ02_9CAUD|nr:hypothetical protein phiLdb_00053 [Lactobacillus phage phiLdb]AGW43730.1 hypothetical protein phiLdb_00053 [Lactobacillus phage phiLdb]